MAIGRLRVLEAHLSGNVFEHLPQAAADPILGTTLAFNRDTHPHKIDLGVGAYRTDEGKPYLFSAVREAERRMVGTHTKEYLPSDDLKKFNRLSRELFFGDCAAVREERIASIQIVSGTGSLRVGAEFISAHLTTTSASPAVPYWDAVSKTVDFRGLMNTLQAAPFRSIVVFHGCAHNPTGMDPSREHWHEIAELMQQKDLIPYFEVAYQGFVSRDLAADAFALRCSWREDSN